MSLQLQITGDAEYGRFIKVLFCGDPGAGKTLISSTFPNPVYASAEGGLMSIARRKIPFVRIDESEKLLLLLGVLEQAPDVRAKLLGADQLGYDRIDTVVIDTIDEVARLLVRERLERIKKDALAIADWGWFGDQMRTIIRNFRNLDMHVVFTCHLKSAEDSESGRMFIKPAIQGQVGDEIAGYVDLALLLKAQQMARNVGGETRRETVRFLQAVPDLQHPWIKDRSGMLPPELEVNFLDDFDRMNDRIFGDLDAVPAADASVSVEVSVPEEELQTAGDPEKSETPVQAGPEVAQPGPVDEPKGPEADQTDVVEESADPGPSTGTLSLDEAQAMAPDQKMRAPGPWPCEECGELFDNEDQRDLSVIKHRKFLCHRDYKTASKKK